MKIQTGAPQKTQKMLRYIYIYIQSYAGIFFIDHHYAMLGLGGKSSSVTCANQLFL